MMMSPSRKFIFLKSKKSKAPLLISQNGALLFSLNLPLFDLGLYFSDLLRDL